MTNAEMECQIMRCFVGACDESCKFYEWDNNISHVICHGGDICEDVDKWLKDACEALEDKEKYRWHNLRKNPDDLPPKHKPIMFTCLPKDAEAMAYGYLNSIGAWMEFCNDDRIKGVIAWRYIEPFEGGGR